MHGHNPHAGSLSCEEKMEGPFFCSQSYTKIMDKWYFLASSKDDEVDAAWDLWQLLRYYIVVQVL